MIASEGPLGIIQFFRATTLGELQCSRPYPQFGHGRASLHDCHSVSQPAELLRNIARDYIPSTS
jgi:hypothetical protein